MVITIEDFFRYVISFTRSSLEFFHDVFSWFSEPFTVLGIQYDFTPLELMFGPGLVVFLGAVIVKWIFDFIL